MNFLCILLFFVHCISSSPVPDQTTSDVSTMSSMNTLVPRSGSVYRVAPNDPDNVAELAETKSLLESLTEQYIEVILYPGSDKVFTWKVTLKDDTLLDQLKNHKGIRNLALDRPPLDQSSPETPQNEKPRKWIAWTMNPNDREQANKTREWLDSAVKDKNLIVEVKAVPEEGGDFNNRNTIAWGGLNLSDEKIEEARKRPDIKSVEEYFGLKDFGIDSEMRTTALSMITKRADIEYTKQEHASEDLVMDSKYSEAIDPLTDYVYEKRAGEGVNIYIIDGGVEKWSNEKELINYSINNILWTEESYLTGSFPWQDDKPNGHGTAVASKVLGQTHGTAKGATLIPVKVTDDWLQLYAAFNLVINDIIRRKSSQHEAPNSVVICSMGSTGATDINQAKNSDQGRTFIEIFTRIHAQGVPIVFAAGNNENDENRLTIDTLPQILEGPDMPLINVGAATKAGNVWADSRGGSQLTIYAPGEDVTVLSKDGKEVSRSGTSMAAPAVAGIIATYLNYDPAPWPTNDRSINRVKAIKEFIESDKSSWERQAGVRMIWNGADQAAHDSVNGNSPGSCSLSKRATCDKPPQQAPPPPVKPTCNGYGPDQNKYADRLRTLSKLVDTFCPEAAAQGGLDANSESIARTYNLGTPEQIDIAMEWKTDLNFKPDEQKCKDIMVEITDSCDTDSGQWKGGGEKMDGEVKYRWSVVNTRSPFVDGRAWGGCEGGSSWFSTKYTIWGSKFAGDDFGKAILNGIADKDVSPTNWNFRYGGGDDHREWTAWVNTIAGAEYAVEPVVEALGGGIDIECS